MDDLALLAKEIWPIIAVASAICGALYSWIARRFITRESHNKSRHEQDARISVLEGDLRRYSDQMCAMPRREDLVALQGRIDVLNKSLEHMTDWVRTNDAYIRNMSKT